MFHTLHHYNLPTHLIETLKQLYTHPYDRLLINGQHTGKHKQIRGVRQGCPLFPTALQFIFEYYTTHITKGMCVHE